MVQLAVRYQCKVAIVRTLRLLCLWAVLVFYPDVNVNAPLDVLLILELYFESSVSKPFNVNFSLQILMHQRLCIKCRFHFLCRLYCSQLLRSGTLARWEARESLWTAWTTWGSFWLFILILRVVQLSSKIV